MNEYLAAIIINGCLGKCVRTNTFEQAVDEGVKLVKENRILSAMQEIQLRADLIELLLAEFDDGKTVSIGQFEN